MNTSELFDTKRSSRAAIVLVASLAILLGAVTVAWLVQQDFGRIEVANAP